MTDKPDYLYEGIFAEGLFFKRRDLLASLALGRADMHVKEKRTAALRAIDRESWREVLRQFAKLDLPDCRGFRVVDGCVVVGEGIVLENQSELHSLIQSLLPWRKGPWQFADLRVDSEWRSNIKFDSIARVLSECQGKSVLDIGSGNGYYAARLVEEGASSVICLDPSERFLLQFELFQRFAKQENVQLELLGFEDAPRLGVTFDVVFCMGVLYHQKNPLAVIEACREALKPGGLLVLESMTYPSQESIAFFPPDRYAKARNVYFLPSAPALIALCQRLGFKSVELINERLIRVEEQRKTVLAPFESLADFLDPNDSSKTIEGFPAPQRAIVTARKS